MVTSIPTGRLVTRGRIQVLRIDSFPDRVGFAARGSGRLFGFWCPNRPATSFPAHARSLMTGDRRGRGPASGRALLDAQHGLSRPSERRRKVAEERREAARGAAPYVGAASSPTRERRRPAGPLLPARRLRREGRSCRRREAPPPFGRTRPRPVAKLGRRGLPELGRSLGPQGEAAFEGPGGEPGGEGAISVGIDGSKERPEVHLRPLRERLRCRPTARGSPQWPSGRDRPGPDPRR